MPIKDPQARREYFKNYMAKKRKGLTVKPEPVLLNPANVKPVDKFVKPKAALLNPIENVKPVKPTNSEPYQVAANPKLTRLIQEWQTQTNYNCSLGCSQNKYCSNCWYFHDNQLIDYKEVNCV